MAKEREQTIDEVIVNHMNKLQRLVEADVAWMEQHEDLGDYSIHVSVLEFNLQKHVEKMAGFRERVVRQIATKCGFAGKEIYDRELSNIRVRRFFARIAEVFSHKFDPRPPG